MQKLTGQCLCGEIKYELKNAYTGVNACHCQQCRRWGGHFWPSVNGPLKEFSLMQGESALHWYASSETAERGFCKSCGSSLFWRATPADKPNLHISVSLGSLDAPHDIKIDQHIFCAGKGTYYELSDRLPAFDKSSKG